MSKIERRYNKTDFRVIQNAGQPTKIVGYASVFNTPSADLGGYIEEIDPDAFDDVLSSNPDVRALWNHNPDVVLGRTASGTLRLSTDSKGLAYEVDLPDTQAARDLSVLMQRGDINQSSFAFIPKRDQWTENPDGSVSRRILEMESLLDVSPVTYPAYPDASSGVRSYPSSMPVEIRSRLLNRDTADGDDDCQCDCPECKDGDCADCSNPDCDDPNCKSERSSRGAEHTKRVDGEDLTADCFLLVGDPEKTETWALPWKFSTDEKTKTHLRNALARFDQVKGFSDEDLKKAWNKLLDLCKKYGIDVSNEEKKSKTAKRDQMSQCSCECTQCLAGACNICSADECMDDECNCYNQIRSLMEMQLQLKRLSVPTFDDAA